MDYLAFAALVAEELDFLSDFDPGSEPEVLQATAALVQVRDYIARQIIRETELKQEEDVCVFVKL